jgi:hypothetical protein
MQRLSPLAHILVQNIHQKTLSFGAKSRKQRVGIFLAFQIYGSKGVTGKIFKALELWRLPAVLLWNTGEPG